MLDKFFAFLAAPVFKETFLFSNRTILVGERFNLHCGIEDDVYPIPTITWNKDNTPLATVTSKTFVHTVTTQKLSDGGVYQCQVNNLVGSINESVSVTVEGYNIILWC